MSRIENDREYGIWENFKAIWQDYSFEEEAVKETKHHNHYDQYHHKNLKCWTEKQAALKNYKTVIPGGVQTKAGWPSSRYIGMDSQGDIWLNY
jgi:hypothetical protein